MTQLAGPALPRWEPEHKALSGVLQFRKETAFVFPTYHQFLNITQFFFPILKGYNPIQTVSQNWLPRALWRSHVRIGFSHVIQWTDVQVQCLWAWMFNITCEIWKQNESNAHCNICTAKTLRTFYKRCSVNIIWHISRIHRRWKCHSGPPPTGHTLSQAITSSLTHSHLAFNVIWFNPKDHQKGFHSLNWQTLNFHLFLIGVRCLPLLPLKISHHLTSNKGKNSANPLQKYWSNTDCTCF